DVLFHLAGTRGQNRPSAPLMACVEMNVLATTRILRSAQQARVKRVIILGTADEYGNQPGPLDEQRPLMPASPYAITKAAATQGAQWLHRREGLPVVILRPFSVFGPEMPAEMFVSQAVRAAVSGTRFVMTEGRQRRDMIYVDDVVRALIATATAPG